MFRKSGRIVVSYIRSDLKWAPFYDFRLNKAGEADVIIRANLPDMEKGAAVAVVAALLDGGTDEIAMPVPAERFPQIAAFTFAVGQEKFSSAPLSSVSFSFKNSSARKLPAGEASCYLHGEYLGNTAFNGALPGDTKELAFGNSGLLFNDNNVK